MDITLNGLHTNMKVVKAISSLVMKSNINITITIDKLKTNIVNEIKTITMKNKKNIKAKNKVSLILNCKIGGRVGVVY